MVVLSAYTAGEHVEVQPSLLESMISSPKKATIRQMEQNGHYMVQLADGDTQKVAPGKIRPLERKTAEFRGNTKMGIKVQRTRSGEIQIKVVSTGSSAEQQGVQKGDFVVGLNNRPLSAYGIYGGDQVDQLKEELKSAPRPLVLNLNTLPVGATRAQSPSDQAADAVFNRIDANNDGVITADELRQAVEQSSPASDRFSLLSPQKQERQGRIRCRNGTIGVGDIVETVYDSAEGGDGKRYGGIVEVSSMP
jgi:hypothetical protein